MAKSVYTHLDFHSVSQLKNALLDVRSTIPTGVAGQILYNASTGKFGYYNGTSWVYPNEYSLPTATASVLGGIKVGSTLAISNGVLNQKSGITTAGTYRSVTVDTYGRVTAGTNPTTLTGYGITDANISNGVITLGSVTITPATTAMLGNAVPSVTMANKMLLSTTTGGTSKWSDSTWTGNSQGILQTTAEGVISRVSPTIWGVTFNGGNVTGVPNLYIGTTKVQTSSTAQHVTGVSSLTIGDAVLSYDSTTHALKLEKRSGTTTDIGFWAEGFVSAFGPSATEGGGTDITAEDIISILNAYTPGEKIKGEVLDVTGGSGGLSWTDLENATSTSHIINSSHLPTAITGLVSRVTSLEGSSVTGITTTGSGNAITSVSKSGNTLTFSKGASFPVLDNGKIPLTYMPDVVLGQVIYGGTLAANAVASLTANAKAKNGATTNTITLTNNTTAHTGYAANEGIYYIVETDQTFAGLSLLVGDWLLSTGSAWKKIDNTDAVTGVKGNAESSYRIGNINITPANIGKATTSALGCVQIGSGLSVDANGVASVNQALTVATLNVTGGRVLGSGDDEGIVISKASNGYAGLVLGSPTGVRSVFYLNANNQAYWRYNNGTTSYDINHPNKSGTIALTSDLEPLVSNVSVVGNALRITKNGGSSVDLTVSYATESSTVAGLYTGMGGQQQPSYFGRNHVGFRMMNTTVDGNTEYKDWLIMDCYNGNDVGGAVAIGVSRQNLNAYIMSSDATRESWSRKARLYHTANANLSTVDWAAKSLTVAGNSAIGGTSSLSGAVFIGTSTDGASLKFIGKSNVSYSYNIRNTTSDASYGLEIISDATGAHRLVLDYLGNIHAGGDILSDGQLKSTVATGTAPFSVSSTTAVANLNADLLDGYHAIDLLGTRSYSSWSKSTTTGTAWFTIFSITDHFDGSAIFIVKAYAHSSLIFSVTKGWSSAIHVSILGGGGSYNGTYAYINGVRVKTDGSVQIGLNAAATAVDINVRVITSRGLVAPTTSLVEDTSGAGVAETLSVNNTENVGISTTAVIKTTNNLIGYYSSSDLRLKKNFADLNLPLDSVASLPLKSYDRTDCGDKRTDGTIAQEVQKLLPNEVYDRGDGYLAMAEGQLGLIFGINAHKEILRLRKRVEELERRLD